MKTTGELLEKRLSVPIPDLDDASETMEALLMHDGFTRYPDGDVLLMDEEAERSVVEAFKAHGAEIPFDINHSTVIKAPKGDPSEAYGFGKRFWREPGVGLKCEVEWNDEGRTHIRAKHYKYLSPVVKWHPETGRVHSVHSVALTNKPLTPDMPALVAAETVGMSEKRSMSGLLKKVMQDGGSVATAEQKIGELKIVLKDKGVDLGDDASFVDIINAAIMKLQGDGGEEKSESTPEAKEDAVVVASVRETLGLAKDADKRTVLKALSDGLAHVGYVPASQFTEQQKRLEALEQKECERTATGLVEKYLSEGKLNSNDENQMKWARARAASDPDDFKVLMDGAPVIIPQGKTSAPGGSGKPADSRDTIITKACSEYDGDTSLRKTCSRPAFVSLKLQEQGMAAVDDTELKKLAV